MIIFQKNRFCFQEKNPIYLMVQTEYLFFAHFFSHHQIHCIITVLIRLSHFSQIPRECKPSVFALRIFRKGVARSSCWFDALCGSVC